MKRVHLLSAGLLLALFLAIACLAAAAPVLEDNGTTAWIGQENNLCLMNAAGEETDLPMGVRDILSFSADAVFCRMANGQVYEISRDGSESRLLQEGAEVPADHRAELQNGQLVLGTVTVFNAEAAVSDGVHVCVVTLSGGKRSLAVYAPDGAPFEDADAPVIVPDAAAIPEPLSMTLVRDTLVITGKDHSVWIGSLKNGAVQKLSPSGNLSEAAALIGRKLFLYVRDEDQLWKTELADALLPDQQTVYQGAATATPTPEPTATPAPTATATPTATPKATATASADDGLIHRGDSGSRVRKMQKRLSELGYPVGKIDGAYGEDTQLAVNLFYDAIGSREHSYLTSKAEKKLYSNSAPAYDPYLPLKKGMESTSVRLMQEQLARLGYDPGKQDGIYGKNTVAAVSLFQDAVGIYPQEDEDPGEIASRELLKRLYSVDAPTLKPVPQVRWEQTAEGWVCYLNGVMATGWKKINKVWYYFSDAGIMQTGWIQRGNDRYYVNKEDGSLLTGWQKIDGDWYYFNTAGKMLRGWFEDKRAEKQKKNGKTAMWYWFDKDGKMVTGEHVIDGKTEVFDSNGLWLRTK